MESRRGRRLQRREEQLDQRKVRQVVCAKLRFEAVGCAAFGACHHARVGNEDVKSLVDANGILQVEHCAAIMCLAVMEVSGIFQHTRKHEASRTDECCVDCVSDVQIQLDEACHSHWRLR